MARKQDPNGVLEDFQQLVDSSIDVWRQTTSKVGTADLQKQLSVDAFQRLATGLEEFRSDWHVAAINRDGTVFRQRVKDEVVKLLSRGQRYAGVGQYVQLSIGDLRVRELRDLLDPDGFHLALGSTRDWQKRAGEELAVKFADRLHHLPKADRTLLDTVVAIRNCIAHRSVSSIEQMNTAIASLSTKRDKRLRRDGYRVQPSGLGAYLWASKDGTRRVERYHQRVRDVAGSFKV